MKEYIEERVLETSNYIVENNSTVRPVSYTHLDVYKRQLLWGSAFACIKIGYKLFNIESKDTMSQILFAGNRFILAGIMVIVTFSIINKKIIKPAQPERIATLSLFQTVLQYVPFYVGLAHTTGVKSSIINGLGVFFTVLVSCLLFRPVSYTHLLMLMVLQIIKCWHLLLEELHLDWEWD